MEGVGELFGQSVDAVLRRPRAVVPPFLVDVAALALGTLLFVAIAQVSLLFPQGYRLPDFPVAVPHALPTVGDVMGPTPAGRFQGQEILLASGVLILLLVPLLAFAEAGFLGVLRAVYLRPADPLEEGRHVDAWSRIREAFLSTGRAHFRTFLWLRAIQALVALAAIAIPRAVPVFTNYGLGVLVVEVLLLWAPYAAIETGRGAMQAIRESVQLVADHLATTLVALLFGFLVTGAVGLLSAPLVRLLGPYPVPFLLSALYLPLGTILSLFLYKVYLSFRPSESAPESTPAPATAPA
ncbi:MAG TPA: hypothetical protein VNX21_06500 [Candidatus Thermoplasmatota archaeon]|nr:hypothetical protein [Candidatus Thermoplasmatota archaeon]